jgi:RNA polymerase sigma factor (sigma-70 family)
MAASRLNRVLQHFARLPSVFSGADWSDGQLLGSFLEHHDEDAFNVLVRRHGPMVLGVCRRILANPHDAEDAFQATFLVLVRKAASISPPEMVGNWLYGVACQTAVKARALAARRNARERQMTALPETAAKPLELWDDLRFLLDRELNLLPDKYRAPIVLCDLEGKSGREAARQLGCPEGTLTGRLSRARAMLARRLKRRGVQTSASSLAVLLAHQAAPASVPASLASSTVQAAALFAAGQAGALSLISENVLALTKGVLSAMMMTRLKLIGTVLLLAGLVGLGGSVLAQRDRPAKPERTDPAAARAAQRDGRGPVRRDIHGVVKSVDVKAGTITLSGGGREAAEEKTYTLSKTAEVAISSAMMGRGGRGGAAREGKLEDLAAGGATVTLTLSQDEKAVESVLAEGPTLRGILKSVEKNMLTISLAPSRRDESTEEKTFEVDPNADIGMDDGRGRRFSVKEAKLADLHAGSPITVWLSVDQKLVQGVLAEGPSMSGVLKAVDAGKNTITLASHPRGGDAEEKTFEVAKNAVVLLDDGRGRRLSIKEGKLADAPVGCVAQVKLSADQKAVAALRVEGPTASGRIKSLDAGKGTITLEIFIARGENPEEKTYSIAKDARVTVDGKEVKLADVKVEENMNGSLRLSLDQKTVQSITAGRPRSRE